VSGQWAETVDCIVPLIVFGQSAEMFDCIVQVIFPGHLPETNDYSSVDSFGRFAETLTVYFSLFFLVGRRRLLAV
jgi:hypothetical protein